MHTPSPTMLIDELATVLDLSVDAIRAKRHAWTRYQGFPRPLRINRNVYVRAEIDAWLHNRANAEVHDQSLGALADEATETQRTNVVEDLKAYARGGS